MLLPLFGVEIRIAKELKKGTMELIRPGPCGGVNLSDGPAELGRINAAPVSFIMDILSIILDTEVKNR